MKKKQGIYRTILFFFIFFQLAFLFLANPKRVDTAITSASATLGNPRLSFYGKLNGAHSAGDTTIRLDTTGNADNSTSHLFPNDTVAVGPNGGKTVGSIIDTDDFALTSGLTVGASDQDPIYSTQSGTLTITFTVGSAIPASGYVLITIPDPAANGNDGAPDTASTLAANGFDLNGMTIADVATTGGSGCTWGSSDPNEVLTAGSGNGHTYKVVNTAATTCSGTPTITFDGTTKDLVNPAPYIGHTQGVADVYTITVATYDSSGLQIETTNTKVAPVEGVLVSATVDETLSFTVTGISADSGTYCGVTRTSSSPDSTATSIPWGTLNTTYTAATHNAVQQLTVTTNSANGYKVYVEENDQLNRDSDDCDSPTDSTADETDNCIKDTVCDSVGCSHTTYRDWGSGGTETYYGQGYSLQNVGSDSNAKFEYDTGGATWNAKQMADRQATENPQDTNAEIMLASAPVDAQDIYFCLRIDIPGTQPAGYYTNRIKYNAVSTF